MENKIHVMFNVKFFHTQLVIIISIKEDFLPDQFLFKALKSYGFELFLLFCSCFLIEFILHSAPFFLPHKKFFSAERRKITNQLKFHIVRRCNRKKASQYIGSQWPNGQGDTLVTVNPVDWWFESAVWQVDLVQ